MLLIYISWEGNKLQFYSLKSLNYSKTTLLKKKKTFGSHNLLAQMKRHAFTFHRMHPPPPPKKQRAEKNMALGARF